MVIPALALEYPPLNRAGSSKPAPESPAPFALNIGKAACSPTT